MAPTPPRLTASRGSATLAGVTEPSPTLVHELWEEADGLTMVCPAGPEGEDARALLGPRARLDWVFEASSHFDAMTKYHERMEWEPYTTTEPWDHEPYSSERIARQRAALTAELGNREVIAASRMARAWREAAVDLGIRFESPFALRQGDATYWCAGWLPDFGAPNGAVIICPHALDEAFDAAESLGIYASGLRPYYYEIYDRAGFSGTLSDWGWFGDPDATPEW